jgi:hypothetical protein
MDIAPRDAIYWHLRLIIQPIQSSPREARCRSIEVQAGRLADSLRIEGAVFFSDAAGPT